MDEPQNCNDIITHLKESRQKLRNSWLARLSDLSSDMLALLGKEWPEITALRRRKIAIRLVELAEEDVTLNFDNIFKAILKDPDKEVRLQAIHGLWENEQPSLAKSLIQMMVSDQSSEVQAAATQALGKFALLAECQELEPDLASELQKALLCVINTKSKTEEVKRRALESVAPLNLPETTIAIRNAYQEGNLKFKASAIYAMGKNCDPRWLPVLIDGLKSKSAEIRYEAAYACGEMEAESSVPDLARLLDDPDAEVQLASVQALGKIGSKSARESLNKCLINPREAVRELARKTLDELYTMEGLLPIDSRQS